MVALAGMELLTEYRFGDVEVRVDGDLVTMRPHGSITPEVAQQLLQLFRLMYERFGRYFMLSDLNDGGGIPAALRRLLAEEIHTCPPAAVAFYGGDVTMRAMNALMIGAIKMVGGESRALAHFPNVEQAQQWLAAERQRLSQ